MEGWELCWSRVAFSDLVLSLSFVARDTVLQSCYLVMTTSENATLTRTSHILPCRPISRPSYHCADLSEKSTILASPGSFSPGRFRFHSRLCSLSIGLDGADFCVAH